MVGALGALFERYCLRRVHKFGHVPELLITFGLSFVILELVQLIWGRTAVEFLPPDVAARAGVHAHQLVARRPARRGWGAAPAAMCTRADAAVRIVCSPFPATRAFMMLVALVMLVALWLLLTRTRIGLVIQSALTHPEMVEALGHNVPRVFMLVFGAGAALAGLAGVIGGSTFVTEPAMAATVGSVIFVVVVVGGMGSLAGAFVASLLIGVIQTFAVALDYSVLSVAAGAAACTLAPALADYSLLKLTIVAGRADPAVPVPGADPDLPAQGPARHAGGLTMDAAPRTGHRRGPSRARSAWAASWSGAASRWCCWSRRCVLPSSLARRCCRRSASRIVACLSYNMLLGQGGMLSFGHAVYTGLGSFVADPRAASASATARCRSR